MIKGDSATGKTTLVDMIREHYENGDASGVQMQCDKECAVLGGKNWAADLAQITDSIVFIDEGNEFVFTNEFADVIQNTDNYYVIVTREGIFSLPYSVTEIYGIRNSGKYGTLKRTYNEFYHIYSMKENRASIKPEVVITEDSNSGYYFFREASSRAGAVCVSADGKNYKVDS